MHWDGYGQHGWDWGNWLGLGLVMLLFWLLLIGGIVLLVRLLRQPGDGRSDAQRGAEGPAGRSPSAEDILAERFARGEVDEEEYRRRREVLRGG